VQQVSCYDKCGYPTSAKAWGCWRHLPRPGETSCSPPAVPLLHACCQVTSCVLSKSVSTCLAGPGVIFLRAGALQASFVLLHPCLRILLAMYSEATACIRQLMCTAVSQPIGVRCRVGTSTAASCTAAAGSVAGQCMAVRRHVSG
jgi:hypothetical protein